METQFKASNEFYLKLKIFKKIIFINILDISKDLNKKHVVYFLKIIKYIFT